MVLDALDVAVALDSNDGPETVLLYHKRVDDGLGDRLMIYVYQAEPSGDNTIGLEQSTGLYSLTNRSTQTLYFTAEQWQAVYLSMDVFRSFFKAMVKAPHFKVDAYHIVGRIYCDAEKRDGEPTLVIYEARYNYRTKKVRRNYFGVIFLDSSTFEELYKQMQCLLRKYPNIASAEPCYMMPDHQNQVGALVCPNCNPWGIQQ